MHRIVAAIFGLVCTAATYDCATKLPDDLDPKAAGMINVEGGCPARRPQ